MALSERDEEMSLIHILRRENLQVRAARISISLIKCTIKSFPFEPCILYKDITQYIQRKSEIEQRCVIASTFMHSRARGIA